MSRTAYVFIKKPPDEVLGIGVFDHEILIVTLIKLNYVLYILEKRQLVFVLKGRIAYQHFVYYTSIGPIVYAFVIASPSQLFWREVRLGPTNTKHFHDPDWIREGYSSTSQSQRALLVHPRQEGRSQA